MVPAPTVAVLTDEFVNSIGVNVHMGFLNTSYADATLVADSLVLLGITHVRDNFPGAEYGAAFEAGALQLAAEGYKFDFVIPVYDGSVNLAADMAVMNSLQQTYPGSVFTVEGPNEVNLNVTPFNGGSAPSNIDQLQAQLYDDVRADPNLVGVNVLNFTIASTSASTYAPYGNVSSTANYANTHIYNASYETPSAGLTQWLPFAQTRCSGSANCNN